MGGRSLTMDWVVVVVVVVVVKLALVDIKILHNMDFMFIIAKTFEE